jgi:hypothetical protein
MWFWPVNEMTACFWTSIQGQIFLHARIRASWSFKQFCKMSSNTPHCRPPNQCIDGATHEKKKTWTKITEVENFPRHKMLTFDDGHIKLKHVMWLCCSTIFLSRPSKKPASSSMYRTLVALYVVFILLKDTQLQLLSHVCHTTVPAHE